MCNEILEIIVQTLNCYTLFECFEFTKIFNLNNYDNLLLHSVQCIFQNWRNKLNVEFEIPQIYQKRAYEFVEINTNTSNFENGYYYFTPICKFTYIYTY